MEVSRRQVQIDNEVEYQKALVEIKDEIRDKEGDEIVEKMKEEIRDWFQEDKEETGKFPDYPSDDEGGSGAVFHPELQPDYEENQDAAINQSDKEESTSKKAKAGKEGNSSKEDKSGADKKGKEDSDDDGFKLTESEFVKGLKAADKTFVGRYNYLIWFREKGRGILFSAETLELHRTATLFFVPLTLFLSCYIKMCGYIKVYSLKACLHRFQIP